MRALPRNRRRIVVLVAALVLNIVAVTQIASAYWASSGSSSDTSTLTSVNKANQPAATAGTGSVALSWTASTLASGAPVTGYEVRRHLGSTSTIVCTSATTACTDTAPVGQTVQYGVTARAGSWRGPESDLTSFTYDATPPDAPSFTGIASDTGVSSSDEITNVAVNTLLGLAEQGSSVTVKRGATTVCVVTATATGTFSCPVSLPLNLTSSYTATAVDAAGNESAASAPPFPVTHDNINPATPTFTGISNDTGSSAADRLTNAASQNLLGTGESGAIVNITKSGSGPGVHCTTVAAGGTFSCGPVTLSSGSNVYIATLIDLAGNGSPPSAGMAVTLDQTNTVSITAISNDTGTPGDRVTNAATQNLLGTTDPNATVVITKGVTTVCTTTANAGGAFSCGPVTLSAGANSYVATSSDPAGNLATSAVFTATLDNVNAAPVFTGISDDTGQFSVDQITKNAPQVLSGTAEPLSTVVVKKGTTTLCTVVASNSGVFTCAVTLALGTNVYTATSTDQVGNVSPVSANFPVLLDQAVPTVTNVMNNRSPLTWQNTGNGNGSWQKDACTGNQICATVLDPGGAGFPAGAPVMQLSGSSGGNSGLCYNSTTNTFQAGCFIATGYNAGTGSLTATITQNLMLDGTYLFTVFAVDLAGNATQVTRTFTIT